jgi:hypothetical protein
VTCFGNPCAHLQGGVNRNTNPMIMCHHHSTPTKHTSSQFSHSDANMSMQPKHCQHSNCLHRSTVATVRIPTGLHSLLTTYTRRTSGRFPLPCSPLLSTSPHHFPECAWFQASVARQIRALLFRVVMQRERRFLTDFRDNPSVTSSGLKNENWK